jgi:hypothetical protein
MQGVRGQQCVRAGHDTNDAPRTAAFVRILRSFAVFAAQDDTLLGTSPLIAAMPRQDPSPSARLRMTALSALSPQSSVLTPICDKLREMRFVRYWVPPILWSASILAASSDLFSAGHTRILLLELFRRALGHPLREDVFAIVHELGRKCGHLTAYGIAAALNYRGLRQGSPDWSAKSAIAAILMAAALGAADEAHQALVPSRTGTPLDVLIDTCGATLALLIVYSAAIRGARRGVTLGK